MRRALAALLLPVALGGCDGVEDATVCPAVVVPSLVVRVTDAATGAPLPVRPSGTFDVGAVRDTLRRHAIDAQGRTVSLQAYGPAGLHSVAVTAPGYAPWTRADVRVTPGTCGPNTVTLDAALAKAGA